MKMSFHKLATALFSSSFVAFGLWAATAQAATCSITSDTVIDQAYIDGGSCTAIDIQGNVSTTWIGVTDLGGGTVTVRSGNVMTMGSSSEMILGATDDFVVETNATATHLLEDTNGLRITAHNITINGALSVSQRGCPQGGPTGDAGYGVDTLTGQCAQATGGYGRGGGGTGLGGGGGSYANIAGGGGSSVAGGSVIYGDSLFPASLGSGGGTGYYSTAYGGAGGGMIQVTSTGTLTVNGTIDANGGAGRYDGIYNGGGGGAGGSVLIHARTLSGSGLISADGGMGAPGGGGGSGGRVAVYFDSAVGFTLGHVTAALGTGGAGGGWGNGVSGGAGTTYLLNRYLDDGAGTLAITSGFDFPASGDYTRDAFTISSGASLRCDSAMSRLTVSSTAWLSLNGVQWNCASVIDQAVLASNAGISTTNTSLTFSSATSVTIATPYWTNTSTNFTVSKPGAMVTWAIPSNLAFRNFNFIGPTAGILSATGGHLILPYSIGITLVSSTIATNVSTTLSQLSIDVLSSWNATGKGCDPGPTYDLAGYGPNLTTGICTVSTAGAGHSALGCCGGAGSGAAYGGTGGGGTFAAPQTTTYGTAESPDYFGSGGGGGFGIPGSAGGGRVRLAIVGDLVLDGSIRADGGNASPYGGGYGPGGGGSGGSVFLHVGGNFAGIGSVTANGGASGVGGGQGAGGGGGGRIAMVYTGLSFSGTSSTSGGAGTNENGGDGSLYTLQLNTAPSSPSSLGPSALILGSATGTTTPTLTFSLSDPDLGDTLRYRIQIDDSSDFSSPVVDYTSALGSQGARWFRVGQALAGGSYTVGSSGQTLSDGNYYWRVKAIDPLSAASSYVTAHGGAVAFVIDTAPRYLSFLHANESGSESITATSVTVVLNIPHFEDVTVHYAATDGTALGSGADYTLASGVATIPAGDTSTTIPFLITNDNVSEYTESFTITLSSPTNALIGSNTSTIYTILDEDPVAPGSGTGGGAMNPGGGAIGGGGGAGGRVMPVGLLGGNSPVVNGSVSIPVSISPTIPGALSLDEFLVSGTSETSARLGSGERAAILRDAQETMGRTDIPVDDLERIANGQIPHTRSLAYERSMAPRALLTFRTIFGHAPNFQNQTENLAWNTLMYRLRFPRNLTEERQGIQAFRSTFHVAPSSPFQWAVVRVMGYLR